MAEMRQVSPTGGMKDQKDVQLHTIPWEALEMLGRVAKYGAVDKEYGNYNFRLGFDWSLSKDALDRHAGLFWNGENIDPESGLPHIIHAAWHCLILGFFQLAEDGDKYHQFDDRPWVYDLKAMIQEAMRDASPTT